MTRTIHVFNKNGKWVVKKDNHKKEISHHRTKHDAINTASEIAGNDSDIHVHQTRHPKNPPRGDGEYTVGRRARTGEFRKTTRGVGSIDGDPLPPKTRKPKPRPR